MDTRDAIHVAGLPIAAAFFRALDPDMQIDILVEEGAQVPAGTDLMRLEGNARAMLTAERSALNTVQHLSGIATMVADYVAAMDNPDCTLLDTRKTIPGLRLLEKYAVRMGGAANHRMGRVPTEASGGINLETIRAKAATGVDYVSVGRLTQSAPAADIGLDFTPL